MATPLSSTPSSPRSLQRQIGGLFLRLDAAGLTVHRDDDSRVELTIEEAISLLDFARTAGVRQLVNRAWLAQQHAAEVGEPDEREGDEPEGERRHKRFAGRAA